MSLETFVTMLITEFGVRRVRREWQAILQPLPEEVPFAVADDGLHVRCLIGLPREAADDGRRYSREVAFHKFGGPGELIGRADGLYAEFVAVRVHWPM